MLSVKGRYWIVQLLRKRRVDGSWRCFEGKEKERMVEVEEIFGGADRNLCFLIFSNASQRQAIQ